MSALGISRDTQYKILDKLTTIGVAVGTRSLLKMGWQSFEKSNPPENPTDPDVIWKDAFIWGAAVGLGVGLSKVLMKIILDESWQKYMGPKPDDE
ncbi:DUF4235 domain-containing protein [Cesiribacter sp. SM1]|uniref:DUF4235 domain-containing protein n=1 Tax=Cesiribacter sp. SM1 TaxID=2861196 RepID=UPI001CD72CC0|nr:DUF4235 domain-containing protein [Cesiribacter sp. SM1]